MFDKEPLCPRLLGNKLQTLKMDDEREEGTRVIFGEYELVAGQYRPQFKELAEIEDGGRIRSLFVSDIHSYFWPIPISARKLLLVQQLLLFGQLQR
jgi:hypothetical protein